MTPRIAFVLAFAFASAAVPTQDAASQETGSSSLSLLPTPRALQSGETEAAMRVGLDGALPVIELTAPAQLPETIDLTSEPEELFQRIRQGFSMPNINNSLVLHHQQYYQNHPEYLRRMVERSSRYLHYIVEEIDRRRMPMELALLPMVESAYNPTAYSRSHASGLWQFVPSTGRQYKLEQNSWVDERRDIAASTAAALEYLQYIYELHGDWHLALASYNWGEGAVGKAINKNKAQGLPTDYLSLTMPEETRNYVPKLQALKNIFSNPKVLANLRIRGVPNRPYFATVTRPSNIDVKLAAQLAGMPINEFMALNPSHNRPVIKSDTPMVIPTDKVDAFVSNLDAHEESDKPLSSWQSYTLRPGEKLEQVAPRFGMTVANLRAINGINDRHKAFPGLTLLVSGQDSAPPPETAAGAEEKPTAVEKPAFVEKPPTVEKPPVIEKPQIAEKPRVPAIDTTPTVVSRIHTVTKGETLLKVARHYGLTLTEIRQLNKLRTDRVTPGTRLAVASPDASDKVAKTSQRITLAEVDAKANSARGETALATLSRTHTLQKGETLLKVAQRYGMTLADLKQLNKLRADKVSVGTKLAVAVAAPEPGNKSAAGSRIAEAESRQSIARSEYAAPRTHTVQKGETLARLAQRYDLSIGDLRRLNKLRGEHLAPGSKLLVSEPEPARTPAARKRVELAELDRKHAKDDDDHEKTVKSKRDKKEDKKKDKASTENTKQEARKRPRLAQYTIRRGDTLVSIAKQFRVEKEDLLRWNRIPASAIKPGQTLTIQLVQSNL